LPSADQISLTQYPPVQVLRLIERPSGDHLGLKLVAGAICFGAPPLAETVNTAIPPDASACDWKTRDFESPLQ
jgi:hypothetical protein